MVILITYGMRYFTMEAVFVVCILAKKLTSVHVWGGFSPPHSFNSSGVGGHLKKGISDLFFAPALE